MQGVEVWNQRRNEHDSIVPDLSGANLSEANLGRADLGSWTNANGTTTLKASNGALYRPAFSNGWLV